MYNAFVHKCSFFCFSFSLSLLYLSFELCGDGVLSCLVQDAGQLSCHAPLQLSLVDCCDELNSVSSQSMCAGITNTSHAHTHTHTQKKAHMYACSAHAPTRMHTCMCARTHTHTHTKPHSHIYTHIRTYMRKHAPRNIHMHECMHTHTHAHTAKVKTISECCSKQASLCSKELQWWG